MCYGIFLNYAALRCDCLSRFLGSAQYSFCALFSCVRFFSQEEDGIRDGTVTGVQTCALPISPRLVAAITITPDSLSKPSISTKIMFKVCSLSSCPPPIPVPLCLPIASNSSIKIIEGDDFLAKENKSLTLAEPTPTSISTNSEPDIEKNGT